MQTAAQKAVQQGRIPELKALLMQVFQTAASVLSHRLPHSAKPHPRFCLSSEV